MLKKATKILCSTFIVYALLVATHLGEFWPLSIYPMFSQAGHPWTRALVRDITKEEGAVDWTDKSKEELPGFQFAMDSVGINQNDLANFILKNEDWSQSKVDGLRTYFQEKLKNRDLMVFKVMGHYAGDSPDSVAIVYKPYIYMRKDTTILSSEIIREEE